MFTTCNPNGNSSLTEIYNCCINKCDQTNTRPNFRRICYATCNEIYHPLFKPKEECAFLNNCYENMFYPSCLEQKQKEIYECCISKCKNPKPTAFAPLPYNLLNREFDIPYDLDCNEYCRQFKIIN